MSTYDELFLSAMQGDTVPSDMGQQNLVEGVIVSKGETEYFLSVGDKSEWMMLFSESNNTLNVGDKVLVASIGTKDGIPHGSQKKARFYQAQENLYQSSIDKTPVSAKIEKLVTNREGQQVGFTVSIDGVEAFLPLSQIQAGADPAALIGSVVTVCVIKHEGNRIVVSERVIREKAQEEHFTTFAEQHKEGDILLATVEMANDNFALVKADQIVCFMPITEYDWKFVKSLKDLLKKGDTFNVQILSIDPSKKSVRVSRKATISNPVNIFFDSRKIGENIPAKVVRFAKGLAIVEDQNGVELLLPLSEMSWTSRVHDPKTIMNIGDRIDVKIKDMDIERKRIVVSLRDLLQNPWSDANTVFAIGSKQEGKVSSIVDFGIFIQFENGLEGLIRKEDIDWNDRNVDLPAKFKKGDVVTATVLHVDAQNEKLRLGIKQLADNPYQNFAQNHPIGSVTSVKVTEIVKDRVFVEVEGSLKAFIHVSQLSNERVNEPKDVCKVGDELQASVRKINLLDQVIELSIRDLTKNEEKQELEKYLGQTQNEAPKLGALFGDILKNK
ncbi:MAG: S1 RNA-binding domain-containing protein [Brevinema sp.]